MKEIDIAKGNNSEEYIVCHYWCFNHGFKFKNLVGNGCHDLMMLCLNLSDIAIIAVKRFDYRYIIHGISRSETIHLLENSVGGDRGYIYKTHIKEINIKNRDYN